MCKQVRQMICIGNILHHSVTNCNTTIHRQKKNKKMETKSVTSATNGNI